MTPRKSPAVSTFRRIASDYLEASHGHFPEEASHLGLDAFNGQLSRNDIPTRRAQVDLACKTLHAVEALPEMEFAGDDWLDRRGFLSMLRTEVLFSRDLPRWQDNPQIHCGSAVESIFDLVVRHVGRLPVVIAAIESRLGKIPDYLAAGASCIKKPVPLWAELAEKSCEGACEFLRQIVPELEAASSQPSKIRPLVEGACKGFESYAATIRRKKTAPANHFSVGRQVFEFLIRERLGLDLSLNEARATGLRQIELLKAGVLAEARRLGARSPREALEKAASDWTPDRPLLAIYEEITEGLRKSVGELDLAGFPPGESLKVLPAPAFLKHQFPTAAYSAPPPFSKRQQGIFWVNDLSLDQSTGAGKLAEIRQHFGLELTSAHEGYPGHHLQFAVQNRHPSKLRRLFAHSIFYEGWTMWCEKLCIDLRIVDHPAAKLIQLHDALWRAYRIVIDCGLHSGELTHASAAKILQEGVGFTKARARGDVNWYTSSPTVPMSYLLGRLEVEKLHRRFVVGEGWDLRRFNDWMLSHGAVPYSWILRASNPG